MNWTAVHFCLEKMLFSYFLGRLTDSPIHSLSFSHIVHSLYKIPQFPHSHRLILCRNHTYIHSILNPQFSLISLKENIMKIPSKYRKNPKTKRRFKVVFYSYSVIAYILVSIAVWVEKLIIFAVVFILLVWAVALKFRLLRVSLFHC